MSLFFWFHFKGWKTFLIRWKFLVRRWLFKILKYLHRLRLYLVGEDFVLGGLWFVYADVYTWIDLVNWSWGGVLKIGVGGCWVNRSWLEVGSWKKKSLFQIRKQEVARIALYLSNCGGNGGKKENGSFIYFIIHLLGYIERGKKIN